MGEYESGNCAIIEDEAHDLHKDANKLKLYKGGYRRGQKVPRIDTDKGFKQKFFHSYCTKLFAGEYLPDDSGFRSRCIVIPMVEGQPLRDEFRTEDVRRLTGIKAGLLAWRMRNISSSLPKIETQLEKRTKSMWKPQLRVAKAIDVEGVEENVRKVALEAYNRKRRRRQNTLEHYLTKAVIQATLETLQQKEVFVSLPLTVIWLGLKDLINGEYVEGKDYEISSDVLNRKVSKAKVGRKCGDILGGEKTTSTISNENQEVDFGDFLEDVDDEESSKQRRYWKFELDKLHRAGKKYFVDEELLEKLSELVDREEMAPFEVKE